MDPNAFVRERSPFDRLDPGRWRASPGAPWPDPSVVDTLRLLHRQERHRWVDEPLEAALPARLADARARVGLPPSEAHDAFADAVATAELLLVLAHRLGARTLGDLVS